MVSGTHIEMRPKTPSDILPDLFEGMGKTITVTIDCPTRVAFRITPALTPAEKQTAKDRLPTYLKKGWEFETSEGL